MKFRFDNCPACGSECVHTETKSRGKMNVDVLAHCLECDWCDDFWIEFTPFKVSDLKADVTYRDAEE